VWWVGKLLLVGKACVHFKPRPCLLVPHFNSISLVSSYLALHFLFLNFPNLIWSLAFSILSLLSYANPSFPMLPIIYIILPLLRFHVTQSFTLRFVEPYSAFQHICKFKFTINIKYNLFYSRHTMHASWYIYIYIYMISAKLEYFVHKKTWIFIVLIVVWNSNYS